MDYYNVSCPVRRGMHTTPQVMLYLNNSQQEEETWWIMSIWNTVPKLLYIEQPQ